MIPKFSGVNIEIAEKQTSRTYDLENGSIIDGKNAIIQSVFLMLSIERFRHIIYSFDYGLESQGLIGKDIDYIKSEIKERIKECLLTDDRIHDVCDFSFARKKDSLIVDFIVKTDYGNIDFKKEVKI